MPWKRDLDWPKGIVTLAGSPILAPMASRTYIGDIITAAFELVSILVFGRLVAFFAEIFRTPSWKGMSVIVVAYVLLCVAVVFIRKLTPREGSVEVKTSWIGLPALCFGFFVLYMAAEAAGFFGWLEGVDTTTMPWWTAFAGLGSIAAALAFFFLLIVGIKPSTPRGPRHDVIRVVCLIVAQFMIVLLGAFFLNMGAESTPEEMGIGTRILIFVPVYVFFLLFMASPRLLLLAQDPTTTAVVAFLIGTCYYVWTTLTGTVW